MHCQNSILIRAPLKEVFRQTADLESWPRVLPHYRWIRVQERNGKSMRVTMAARRGFLPVCWTSQFEVADTELHFRHLKSFTRGMNVRWTFSPSDEGVMVSISHELDRWYGKFLARYFIQPIASRTLVAFKAYLECGGLTPLLDNSKALASQRTPNRP